MDICGFWIAPTVTQHQQLELGGYVASSAAIHAGRAYLGTFGNEVLGIDLDTGEIRWRYAHAVRKFPFLLVASRCRPSSRHRRPGQTRTRPRPANRPTLVDLCRGSAGGFIADHRR